ncbi:uncharacterized protein RAG0_10197 [Rhynchosporium agropyri]|uniref:Uncharacterized protein n=2 Tax=Rhynchosporium TaxID=38037 RepID=A0A1E1KYX5_9HELO|nr:uncharacterized protein RAG0_10197 [Rhynchosporium agropyri]CZT07470.1 uncharacterized protein RCO7_14921 [Rhynchosporium commune]
MRLVCGPSVARYALQAHWLCDRAVRKSKDIGFIQRALNLNGLVDTGRNFQFVCCLESTVQVNCSGNDISSKLPETNAPSSFRPGFPRQAPFDEINIKIEKDPQCLYSITERSQ